MRKSRCLGVLFVVIVATVHCLVGCGKAEEKTDNKPTSANPTPFPGTENSKFVMPTQTKGN